MMKLDELGWHLVKAHDRRALIGRLHPRDVLGVDFGHAPHLPLTMILELERRQLIRRTPRGAHSNELLGPPVSLPALEPT
jgi:hypothetical protein